MAVFLLFKNLPPIIIRFTLRYTFDSGHQSSNAEPIRRSLTICSDYSIYPNTDLGLRIYLLTGRKIMNSF